MNDDDYADDHESNDDSRTQCYPKTLSIYIAGNRENMRWLEL
jgi:hypothetical protein